MRSLAISLGEGVERSLLVELFSWAHREGWGIVDFLLEPSIWVSGLPHGYETIDIGVVDPAGVGLVKNTSEGSERTYKEGSNAEKASEVMWPIVLAAEPPPPMMTWTSPWGISKEVPLVFCVAMVL